MAYEKWFGGTGDYNNPANWDPPAVPHGGDTAYVEDGTVKVTCHSLQHVTLALASYGYRAPPPTVPEVDLRCAIVGNVSLITGSSHWSNGAAIINVHDLALFTGHVGPQGTMFSLTVNLSPGSVMINQGTFENYSIIPSGIGISGPNAVLVNQGLLQSDSGNFHIDTTVLGTGTIEVRQSSPDPRAAGSVELGGLIGPGQTVEFGDYEVTPLLLELDKPAVFLATIDGFAAKDMIQLNHTDAASEEFRNGVLRLYDAGHHLLARLHFQGSYSTDQFALSHSDGSTLITLAGTEPPKPADLMMLPAHAA